MLNPNFAILGSLIIFAGGANYIFETIKGKIKPNRVSWLLWAIAPLLAFSAEINQGVGLASLLTFSVGFLPLLVFIASFVNKKSYWKVEKIDIICAAFSILGLILWYITKIGNIAILFGIFADFSAGVPTLIKSFKDPASESPNVFTANAISAVITLLTIKNWNFENYGFPVYILLMMGLIAFVISTKIGKRFK